MLGGLVAFAVTCALVYAIDLWRRVLWLAYTDADARTFARGALSQTDWC
jgi:hypothetical protein